MYSAIAQNCCLCSIFSLTKDVSDNHYYNNIIPNIAEDTVGDTSSVYSEKFAGAIVCCSRCREHSDETDSERQSLIHDPAFATDEKEQSLIESYREQLLTSSNYHDQHQLQDNDFEVSLAT